MRYAAGHKERTRAKILEAAGTVFRRRGYHASGVDGVMEAAGLTSGGFYAHFDSKEQLLAEVLTHAAGAMERRHDEASGGASGRAWARAFVERYLSTAHRLRPDEGCSLAALVSEVARSGVAVKKSFEAVVRDLAGRLSGHPEGGADPHLGFAILALCVGGIGLSRSVADEDLGERILMACRALAVRGLDAGVGTGP